MVTAMQENRQYFCQYVNTWHVEYYCQYANINERVRPAIENAFYIRHGGFDLINFIKMCQKLFIGLLLFFF